MPISVLHSYSAVTVLKNQARAGLFAGGCLSLGCYFVNELTLTAGAATAGSFYFFYYLAFSPWVAVPMRCRSYVGKMVFSEKRGGKRLRCLARRGEVSYSRDGGGHGGRRGEVREWS